MNRFRLLGTQDLRDSQDREVRAVLRRPKLLALLGYLAAARPLGFQRRDALLALLWPELDQSHARNALSQSVHVLRRALGAESLLARGDEELGIAAERLWCDVREFEAALARGEPEAALELYRGGLLAGFHLSDAPDFERWLEEEGERLLRRACDGARLLAERDAGGGNLAGAARWVQRLTELAPYDEMAARRLIEMLDRLGDRGGAVRAYAALELRLRRDLEVEPSADTRRLIEGIRASPARATTVATIRSADSPIVAAARTDTAAAPDASGAHGERGRGPRRLRAVAGLGAVVVGLVGGGWLLGVPFGSRRAGTTPPPRTIVVLPFANMGPADAAYFAEGMTEEITARLAGIPGLRVIGSASAHAYSGKSIPEIARGLGVDYVLEGSVRWQKPADSAARVRVTPQLVSAGDGMHLWAEVYDEPLDEIFRVQDDIAEQVVRALDLTLFKSQPSASGGVPTRNLDAYEYYLRGLDYRRRGSEERFARAAVRMFELAVELDSSFAVAYAALASAHNQMYWQHYDRSDARRASARRAADRVRQLAPDLPEARMALAGYHMAGLEYDQAYREWAAVESAGSARGGSPASRIFLPRGVLKTRQGRLREALVDLEQAWQRDPASTIVATNYALAFDLLREFPRAEALYDRAIALAPDRSNPYWWKAWLYLRWDGRTDRARGVLLEEARAAGVAGDPILFLTRVLVEVFDGRYEQAVGLLAADSREVIADQFRFIPRTLLCAQVHGLMRRADLERAYADSARIVLEKRLAERPDDPRLHSALGIAYASLGRSVDAVRAGQRAVGLLPVERDAFHGYFRVWDLARIHAMVGDHDLAVDRLEYLLSIPGYLTVPLLRLDPTWDPLRDHPRFRRLVPRKRAGRRAPTRSVPAPARR